MAIKSSDKLSNGFKPDYLKLAEAELKSKNYSKSAALFDAIFDGDDTHVANFLGYIYCDDKSPLHDVDKGMKYYRISATAGSLYGQQGLAAALKGAGKDEEALVWMIKSSENGGPEASRILSHYFHEKGDRKNRIKYLLRAAEQGNILAIQKLGWLKMLGRLGLFNIPSGFRDLVHNVPKILAYAKQVIAEDPERFK